MSPADAVSFTAIGMGLGVAVTEGLNRIASKALPHGCEACADTHGDQAFTDDEIAALASKAEVRRLQEENQRLRALLTRYGIREGT